MSYFNFLLPKYCLTDLTYHNLTYSLFPSPSPAGGTITGHAECQKYVPLIKCPVDKMFRRKNVPLKKIRRKSVRRKSVRRKNVPLKKIRRKSVRRKVSVEKLSRRKNVPSKKIRRKSVRRKSVC